MLLLHFTTVVYYSTPSTHTANTYTTTASDTTTGTPLHNIRFSYNSSSYCDKYSYEYSVTFSSYYILTTATPTTPSATTTYK